MIINETNLNFPSRGDYLARREFTRVSISLIKRAEKFQRGRVSRYPPLFLSFFLSRRRVEKRIKYSSSLFLKKLSASKENISSFNASVLLSLRIDN